MKRSKHKETKYLSDEKRHQVIDSEVFENLFDCVRPAKKEEWEGLRERDGNDPFRSNAS